MVVRDNNPKESPNASFYCQRRRDGPRSHHQDYTTFILPTWRIAVDTVIAFAVLFYQSHNCRDTSQTIVASTRQRKQQKIPPLHIFQHERDQSRRITTRTPTTHIFTSPCLPYPAPRPTLFTWPPPQSPLTPSTAAAVSLRRSIPQEHLCRAILPPSPFSWTLVTLASKSQCNQCKGVPHKAPANAHPVAQQPFLYARVSRAQSRDAGDYQHPQHMSTTPRFSAEV